MSTSLAKASEIQALFERIAQPYDFFNHLFSGGVDVWWRNVLVREVERMHPALTLDLATGSGDVYLAMERKGLAVLGADFCLPMLQRAKLKGCRKLLAADALQIPLQDESVEAVTVAFGFRNFTDREKSLHEILRILKPGGRLFLLEFSQPYTWLQPFYFFYVKKVMPRMVHLTYRQADAYLHLATSIAAFPSCEMLEEQMVQAGFQEIHYRRLTFGIASLHQGIKPRGFSNKD